MGYYVFSSFCKEYCQTQTMNVPLNIEGRVQTLNNLSIKNLNENLQINIHQNVNSIKLQTLSFVTPVLQGRIEILICYRC